MPKLIFLSRLAFISNICYAFGFVIRLDLISADNNFWETVLLIGYFPGIIFNIIVNIFYVYRIISRRGFDNHPKWLAVTNAVFFIIQITDLII